MSGPIAVGKTAIAKQLVDAYRFNRIRSGGYLLLLAESRNGDKSRKGLQDLGDSLDRDTDYRWIVDDVAQPAIENGGGDGFWLLDSIRKHRQLYHFRDAFGSAVVHVHFTAAEEVLRSRYTTRLKSSQDYHGFTSYDDAVAHPNEVESRSLESAADLIIDVTGEAASTIAARIMEKI